MNTRVQAEKKLDQIRVTLKTPTMAGEPCTPITLSYMDAVTQTHTFKQPNILEH